MADAVPIPPLLATFLERLDSGESLDFEFKAAKGGLPRSLWPTVSAFANTQGGWIVLGVDESTGKPEIAGVTNASRQLQEFFDLSRNANKISVPPCGETDARIELLGSKHLIVIRVPAVSRRVRPVYINGNPYEGTYIRRHSGDYKCSKAEVDRMIRDASEAGIDSMVLDRYGIEDLDQDALLRYRRRFQTQDPGSPRNGFDDMRFLESIGAFRRDRESGAVGLTLAGLLLLGKPEAIREQRTRHLIDYRRVSGEEDLDTRWDDRVAWEGNLLGAFETIYPKLTEGQPVAFHLEGGARVDQGPVQVALREALVNLLVHADYSDPQASLVKRASQGCLFRNPGNSRIPEYDLFTGDRSDPRNPTLVRMFRLIGLADEAGTGMPKIIEAWRKLGFRLPSIDAGTERYEFMLHLRYIYLLADEDRQWLQELGGEWSEAEALTLVVSRHDGEVDNAKVRSLTGMHSADVTRMLGGLRSRNFLQMLGDRRSARYELGPAASLVDQVPTVEQRTPDDKTQTSDDKDAGSVDKVPGSEDNGSASMDSTAVHRDGIPAQLWSELERIASPSRERGRLDPASRARITLEMCQRTPLSLRQLTGLLGRSEIHVRAIVRPLLRSGELTYTIPDQPSHPRQRYTASQPKPAEQ